MKIVNETPENLAPLTPHEETCPGIQKFRNLSTANLLILFDLTRKKWFSDEKSMCVLSRNTKKYITQGTFTHICYMQFTLYALLCVKTI